MHKKIREHFRKVDPVLFEYIKKVGAVEFKPAEDLFEDLCESIIGQQLSEKAGATIYERFKKLFVKGRITPVAILKLSDKQIRECGTSFAKINSLKDLSTKVIKKDLDLERLRELTNDEVMEQLTKVRGIGPWTAEMFLMFGLGREDVFSHGDLGLKNAIKKIYKFKKDPTREKVEKIVKKWIPYRTYACRILWKSLSLKA